MYELNPETKQIDFSHNPFSMPQGGLEALMTKDPLEIYADQYDLVCNGLEMLSGAVRNHLPEIMYKAFEIAGHSKEHVDEKFGGMIRAFKFGAPPHAGCAPGIARIVMLLAEEQAIREVIPFPLAQNGEDLMMGAPSGVFQKQLDEVHIQLKSATGVEGGRSAELQFRTLHSGGDSFWPEGREQAKPAPSLPGENAMENVTCGNPAVLCSDQHDVIL